VLVVDDSAFFRKLLRGCVEDLPGVQVVGTASNGKLALAKIDYLKPDFVVLDIEMPELGGLETLQRIHRRWPQIGVVIVSGQAKSAAELTVQALARGALEFVPKSSAAGERHNIKELTRSLRAAIDAFRQSRVRAHPAPPPPGESASRLRAASSDRESNLEPLPKKLSGVRIEAIGIASSTGGPQALMALIPRLPAEVSVPVFVVQHMPPMFTAALARSLDRQSALTVCEAQEGQRVGPGMVYIAPGGLHMVLRGRPTAKSGVSIGLLNTKPENGCRPSADVLFRSMATSYGGAGLGVVLTGMGADGTAGVRAMKQRGASCITQLPESCVISGMPRAVVEAGLSDESLDPQRIAERIGLLLRFGS